MHGSGTAADPCIFCQSIVIFSTSGISHSAISHSAISFTMITTTTRAVTSLSLDRVDKVQESPSFRHNIILY